MLCSASADTSVLYATPHIAAASYFLFASVARITRFGYIQSFLSQSVNLIALALEAIKSEPLTSSSLYHFHWVFPVLFAWSFLPRPCPSTLSSTLSPLERIISVPIHVSHPQVQPSHPHVHLSLLTPSLTQGIMSRPPYLTASLQFAAAVDAEEEPAHGYKILG